MERVSFIDDFNKEKEFKGLFKEYYGPFCLYARRFIYDDRECEDIVQSAFASLWKNFHAVDPQSPSAIGYIKTTVRNRCLDWLKHKKYESGYVDDCLNKTPSYADSPEQVLGASEMYRELIDILESLPETERKSFLAAYSEGRSQDEISKSLGISVKTVGRYNKKVMDILRSHFKDYLPILLILISGE